MSGNPPDDPVVTARPPRPRLLTVKEYAALYQVTERTVRTWIAKGAVVVHRTPGGGIRLIDRDGE